MYSSRLPRQAEIDAAASCDRQLVSLFTVTTLAAIGDIARFPSAEQLVGLCRSGRQGACKRAGALVRTHHQKRPQGPLNVARAFLGLTYDLGAHKVPDSQTSLEYTRKQLDRLGIGADLTHIP